MTTEKDTARSRGRVKRLQVACLEGEWSARLDDTLSVEPMLDLLKRGRWIDYAYRRVRSGEDLLSDLVKLTSQQQYQRFELFYLAAHGREGVISVGNGIPLAELQGLNLSGRVLHLAGCAIARSRAREEFKELRRETGASAVCGYTADVDWTEAAAFELLLLSFLAYERTNWPYNALRETRESYAGLAQRLGFVAVWRGGELPRPARRRTAAKSSP